MPQIPSGLLAGANVQGIVDGTVVTGATLVADGSQGQILVYEGTPGTGNLIGSWSGAAGQDPYGNAYPQGLNVTVGAISGTDYIINMSGMFFYSGTPANGNLVVSIAPTGGTDGYGNPYDAGVTTYNSALATEAGVTVQIQNDNILFADPLSVDPQTFVAGMGQLHVNATGRVPITFINSGADDTNGTHAAFWLSGTQLGGGTSPTISAFGSTSGGTIQTGTGFLFNIIGTLVFGQPGGGLPVASGPTMAIGSGGAPAITAAAGGSAAGLSGFVPVTPAADFTNYTVTQAAFTQCSKAWSIPAGDALAGTTYRLTVSGSGTQGSTARTLAFGLGSGGTGIATLPNTFASVSVTFWFRTVIELTVITTGTGGTANVSVTATAGATTTAVTGTSVAGFAQAAAVNTVAGFSLEAFAEWGSTSGAPTFTSYQSYLERLGP